MKNDFAVYFLWKAFVKQSVCALITCFQLLSGFAPLIISK